jgi:hypothetical protein
VIRTGFRVGALHEKIDDILTQMEPILNVQNTDPFTENRDRAKEAIKGLDGQLEVIAKREAEIMSENVFSLSVLSPVVVPTAKGKMTVPYYKYSRAFYCHSVPNCGVNEDEDKAKGKVAYHGGISITSNEGKALQAETSKMLEAHAVYAAQAILDFIDKITSAPATNEGTLKYLAAMTPLRIETLVAIQDGLQELRRDNLCIQGCIEYPAYLKADHKEIGAPFGFVANKFNDMSAERARAWAINSFVVGPVLARSVETAFLMSRGLVLEEALSIAGIK